MGRSSRTKGVARSAGRRAATRSSAPATSAALTTRRRRWANKLPRLGPGDVPHAFQRRPELRGVQPAHIIDALKRSTIWQQEMLPALQAEDKNRKRRPLYAAEELEALLLYKQAMGLDTVEQVIADLKRHDRGEARRLLGFDRNRNPNRRGSTHHIGVPSEATISRHRRRFGDKRRHDLWRRLFEEVVSAHLRWSAEMREEASIMYVDGTTLPTCYTAPIRNPRTGAVVNADRVTCQDGGFVGATAPRSKQGHGYTGVTVITQTGIPLLYTVAALNESERDLTHGLFRRDWTGIEPNLEPNRIRALCADGANHKPETRALLRRLGILEVIHLASHANDSATRKRKRELDNERIPIDGYRNWFANGHRELICRCGQGRLSRRFGHLLDGRAYSRVEGRCPTCGTVTITSGDWRLARNPRRFTRCLPDDSEKCRDWLFGHSLTYNDWIATELGRSRFGRDEGFHGLLATAYGLKRRRRRRSIAQTETELAMVFTFMHATAILQRQLKTAGTSGAAAVSQLSLPPP